MHDELAHLELTTSDALHRTPVGVGVHEVEVLDLAVALDSQVQQRAPVPGLREAALQELAGRPIAHEALHQHRAA